MIFFTTNFCCRYLIQQQLPGIDKCTCNYFDYKEFGSITTMKKNGPEVEKLMKTGKFELSISCLNSYIYRLRRHQIFKSLNSVNSIS